MNTMEQYYTPEQLETLSERRKTLGEDGMKQGERDWRELMDQISLKMNRGVDPLHPEVLQLALTWRRLIQAFTGGDKAIESNLKKLNQEQPDIAADRGFTFDPEMAAYIGKALAAVEQRS